MARRSLNHFHGKAPATCARWVDANALIHFAAGDRGYRAGESIEVLMLDM